MGTIDRPNLLRFRVRQPHEQRPGRVAPVAGDWSGDDDAPAAFVRQRRRGSWRERLVTAVRHAGGERYLDGDRLPEVAPLGDTAAEQRASAWPGYHTDDFELDVRH